MATESFETQKAFVRPKLDGVIVDLKRRRPVWEGEPADLRARVDVDVRRDAPGVI
jgi:hypothetical protein